MVSARKGRLEQKAEGGRRGAAVALQLTESPNRFLSTVQVGITLIGTFAAAFGGASIAEVERLISNVFNFTGRAVRTLMTPRTQITAVAIDTPFEEVLRVVTDSGFSRIPVYGDSLDQIAGILYVKDLLQAWGRPEMVDLRTLLRAPIYLLESQRALVAIPAVGETTSWHGNNFEVVDMDERRIDKIIVRPPRTDVSAQTKGVLASGAILPRPVSEQERGQGAPRRKHD